MDLIDSLVEQLGGQPLTPMGLTQNRPSVIAPPWRTSVLSASGCLAGTNLRKP